MNSPPKRVTVDLNALNNKKIKSTTQNKLTTHKQNTLEFSFSHENSPIPQKQPARNKIDRVSKNLFKPPQQRTKIPVKYQQDSNRKLSQDKSASKERDSLYRKTQKNDKIFKKSIDKLKSTFFNGVRNNKALTVKTLQEIGKYAKSRALYSKQKNKYPETQERKSSSRKKRNIPVEFVGFDPNSTVSKYQAPVTLSKARLAESKEPSEVKRFSSNKDVADIGTYFNFQEQFKKQLKLSQEQQARSRQPQHSQLYPKPHREQPLDQIHRKKEQQQVEYAMEASPPEFDSINQIEIDAICQIFEMCQKYNENDTIALHQFLQLLKQFQRLYFIRLIQQSEAGSSPTKLRLFQNQFSESLREFQEIMKIVFYRKQTCDIYDCLYYLKQSNKLDKLCTLFMGIKNLLQL